MPAHRQGDYLFRCKWWGSCRKGSSVQCGTDKFFPNRTKIQGRLFRGPGDPRVGTRGCCNTEEPGKRQARTLKFQRTRCYNCLSALTVGFDRPRAPDVSTRKKKKKQVGAKNSRCQGTIARSFMPRSWVTKSSPTSGRWNWKRS